MSYVYSAPGTTFNTGAYVIDTQSADQCQWMYTYSAYQFTSSEGFIWYSLVNKIYSNNKITTKTLFFHALL